MKQKGIYIFTFPNGKQYVGKSVDIKRRIQRHFRCEDGQVVSDAIMKYGKENVKIDVILYPGILSVALCAIEEWKIRQIGSKSPNGYNLTSGGDGFDSNFARDLALDRLSNGTHHFLTFENEVKRRKAIDEVNSRKLMDGTHPFLGGKLAGESSRQRVKDGTHHFLGGDLQRKVNAQRVKDGTHNFFDPQVGVRGRYMQRMKRKQQRGDFYRIYAVLLTSKAVFNRYCRRQLEREGFFDKQIPDTSESKQLELWD